MIRLRTRLLFLSLAIALAWGAWAAFAPSGADSYALLSILQML